MVTIQEDDLTKGDSGQKFDMPTLQQVQTQGSIILTPEMFERLYFSPPVKIKGDLHQKIGNPTPMALAGFIIAFSPLVFGFLGWRQFTGGGATIGAYWFMGGLLPIIGAIFELIGGNSFGACFFGVYGAWFMGYAASMTPDFAAYLSYSPDPTQPQLGAVQPAFLSGQAYWCLLMSIFSLFILICCLRTNVCLVINFSALTLIFMFAGASFWLSIDGKTTTSHRIQRAAGYIGFIALIVNLYSLLSLLFLITDFPIQLPPGDLSTWLPSATDLRKRKQVDDVEKGE